MLLDINETYRNNDIDIQKSISENVNWYIQNVKGKNKDVSRVSNLPQFIPGKFYKFLYNPDTKETLKYYDRTPLIYLMGFQKFGNGSICAVGLNFDYFPRQIKKFILSKIYNIYNKQIDNIISKNPNNAIKQKSLDITYNDLNSLFLKYNLQFSTRNYFVSNMKLLNCISFEHIGRIPYIEEYNFVGMTYTEIMKLYFEELKKD